MHVRLNMFQGTFMIKKLLIITVNQVLLEIKIIWKHCYCSPVANFYLPSFLFVSSIRLFRQKKKMQENDRIKYECNDSEDTFVNWLNFLQVIIKWYKT